MIRATMRLLLGVTVAYVMYGALTDGAAVARTLVRSPFGATTPVTVYVGCAFGSQQLVVWSRKSDAACATTLIGNTPGLADDTEVIGSNANDTMYISGGGNNFSSLCGFSLTPVTYNGHYLDLYGQGGGDDLRALTSGDSWLFGGDGDDLMFSVGPGNLFGGNGNDALDARGTFSVEGLYGEAGADCLEDDNAAASTIDCGPGTDLIGRAQQNGAIPFNIGCEQITQICP